MGAGAHRRPLRRSRGGDARSWLLIKHRDDWAGDVDITEFAPRSVKSDGDFEDILAADKPDVWDSNRPAEGGEAGAMLATIIERAAALKAGRAVDADVRGESRRRRGPQAEDRGREGRAKDGNRQARQKAGGAKPRAKPRQIRKESTRMKKADFILFSGGAPGAEAEFGACAERHGIEEVNFTFDGHTDRPPPRRPRPQPRGAAGGRRQPRVRVAADAPALHRQSD